MKVKKSRKGECERPKLRNWYTVEFREGEDEPRTKQQRKTLWSFLMEGSDELQINNQKKISLERIFIFTIGSATFSVFYVWIHLLPTTTPWRWCFHPIGEETRQKEAENPAEATWLLRRGRKRTQVVLEPNLLKTHLASEIYLLRLDHWLYTERCCIIPSIHANKNRIVERHIRATF